MMKRLIKTRGEFVRLITYCIVLLMLVSVLAACGNNSSGNTSAPKNFIGIPQLVEAKSHNGWERSDCVLCHPAPQLNDIHSFNKKLAKSFEEVGYDNNGACLYCHNTNGLKGVTSEDFQCTKCHFNPKIVASASLFDGNESMHAIKSKAEGMTNADCVVCHAQTNMNGKIEFGIDFTQTSFPYGSVTGANGSLSGLEAERTDFCLNCHSGNGAFGIMPPSLIFAKGSTNIYDSFLGLFGQTFTADVHGEKNGNGQAFGEFRGDYRNSMTVGCTQCHDVHTSDNTYLFTQFGDSAYEADDAALNAPVSVKGNDFTQLCALCHTSPKGYDTENGLKSVYHTSEYDSNCTKCHFHGAGSGNNNLF